ncbi:hypothetical protein [Flavobacterium oreochromis]|uniref:hypothetical protein n=1 Tax=Flavobacterium oreochromis TaxID=2906078 RepID=UPI00385C1246
MKNTQESGYVKRTQKDYTTSFKLQVVQEIEKSKIFLLLNHVNSMTFKVILQFEVG